MKLGLQRRYERGLQVEEGGVGIEEERRNHWGIAVGCR